MAEAPEIILALSEARLRTEEAKKEQFYPPSVFSRAIPAFAFIQ
jgi:hypothetical protein